VYLRLLGKPQRHRAIKLALVQEPPAWLHVQLEHVRRAIPPDQKVGAKPQKAAVLRDMRADGAVRGSDRRMDLRPGDLAMGKSAINGYSSEREHSITAAMIVYIFEHVQWRTF
jgi:hypothetical protein